jgi:spore coat polysaccharide biosynthesis protein SpsF (cytidylyltransferase family)
MDYNTIITNADFKKLQKLQNHPKHENTDILTICGFMKSEEEIKDHRENCETDSINWNIANKIKSPLDVY